MFEDDFKLDAKDLHAAILEKRPFLKWIESMEKKLDMEDGVDIFPLLGMDDTGTVNSVTYLLTFDAAIRICAKAGTPAARIFANHLRMCSRIAKRESYDAALTFYSDRLKHLLEVEVALPAVNQEP